MVRQRGVEQDQSGRRAPGSCAPRSPRDSRPPIRVTHESGRLTGTRVVQLGGELMPADLAGELEPVPHRGIADARVHQDGSTACRPPKLEHREERLLRNLHAADLLHPLLPLLLLLEELALARDVAAVALGDHVLAHRLHGLARDDLRADRGLDRHLELLARDLLAQPLGEHAAGGIGLVAVDDHRQRVDLVAGEQDVELHEVALAHPDQLVVERGVAARARLQLVEEVEHDLGERQVVVELHALLREEGHVHVRAAALLAELHHGAHVLLRREDRRADVGLLDRGDLGAVRHVGRRVDHDLAAVGEASRRTRRSARWRAARGRTRARAARARCPCGAGRGSRSGSRSRAPRWSRAPR